MQGLAPRSATLADTRVRFTTTLVSRSGTNRKLTSQATWLACSLSLEHRRDYLADCASSRFVAILRMLRLPESRRPTLLAYVCSGQVHQLSRHSPQRMIGVSSAIQGLAAPRLLQGERSSVHKRDQGQRRIPALTSARGETGGLKRERE